MLDADSRSRETAGPVKVLLDENLPHLLRNNLGDHDVFTVRYKGWAGLKNGELLKTAEDDGFQVFITGDQTISLRAEPYRPTCCNSGLVVHRLAQPQGKLAANPRGGRKRCARFLSGSRVWQLYPKEASRAIARKVLCALCRAGDFGAVPWRARGGHRRWKSCVG